MQFWKTKPSNNKLEILNAIELWNGIPKDINHLDDLNRLNEIVSDKRLAKEQQKKRIDATATTKNSL
jgi:hypothetical protein